jgi:tetratricopeptide (TPR) repeat protein
LSLEQLSPPAAQLLLRLSVLPDGAGPEIIEALTETEEWDKHAEELVAASVWHLQNGRYRMHPLVRRFALEILGAGRAEAEYRASRELTLLAQLKGKGINLITGHPGTMAKALAWFGLEWQNVLACAAYATAAADWATLCNLTDTIFHFCFIRGYWTDAERLYRQALDASRLTGDRGSEGRALGSLGFFQLYQSRLAEADTTLLQATEILRWEGDRAAEVRSLTWLVRVHHRQCRWADAEAVSEQSLAIFRQLKDHPWEVVALFYRGNLYVDLQRWDEAEISYRQALELTRKARGIHRLTEASILNGMGVLYQHVHRWEDAERNHFESLAIHRDLGEQWGAQLGSQWQGRTLKDFARLRAAQGNWVGAVDLGRQALAVLQQSEDRESLAEVRRLVEEWENKALSNM